MYAQMYSKRRNHPDLMLSAARIFVDFPIGKSILGPDSKELISRITIEQICNANGLKKFGRKQAAA